MSAYSYRTGRRTANGVEICQYYMQDRPNEKISVIAYGRTETFAAVICNRLNQNTSPDPVTQAQPLPGGY